MLLEHTTQSGGEESELSARRVSRIAGADIVKPSQQENPADGADAKRNEPNEQTLSQPRQADHLAMRDLVEGGVRQDPPGVKPDRQPERPGLEARMGEDRTNQKQCGEARQNQHRIGELIQGMSERDKT